MRLDTPNWTARARLNKQTNAAVLDPNIQQRFADLGVVAVPPNSPNEFAKFLAENIEKWTKVIKFAGIKPECSRLLFHNLPLREPPTPSTRAIK